MPAPTDIKFKCPTCGTTTRATIATGRLQRHSPQGTSERCAGSRHMVFKPGQPDTLLGGDAPAPADFDWYAQRRPRLQPARLTAADIKTAGRLLKATRTDPKRYKPMQKPLQRFLDNARAHRPDLFQRAQTMRVNRPAAPIEADPKKQKQPLTKPSGKAREILVGKRN